GEKDWVARRGRRPLGTGQVPIRRMTTFRRLLEYARPYRGRLTAAVAAMVLYGAASAGLAALIQPIFDEVLPTRQNLLPITAAILVVYLLKGVGAYLSGYLMTD